MTDDFEIDRQLRSVMATLEREAEPTTGFATGLIDALQAAAKASRRPRRIRWLLPAVAAAAVATIAGIIALNNGPHPTPTPPGRSAATRPVLTPQQRTLALHVAHTEAEGSNPKRPGPIIPVRGWPAYVNSVSATLMTRAEALRFLDNSTSSRPGGTQVLVIQMRGRFGSAAEEPLAPNGQIRSRVVHGTVITAVVSLADGQVTDGGIGRRHHALPNATVLYTR